MNWKQIVCLSLLLLPSAYGVELPGFASPELHLSNINFHTVHPKAAYDNNIGKFSVNYSLPLPVGQRSIRSSLEFSYNSQLNFNLGYGLGFELHIPFIQKVTRHERAAYLFDNGNSVFELGFVDGKLVELELNSFAKYEINGEHIIVTSPDGVVKTFNGKGLLIKEVHPGQNNIISYAWDNYRLSKITLPESSVVFNYEKCSVEATDIKNGDFPVYFKNALREQNFCLKQVKFEDRSVFMDYNSYRGLSHVSWNNDQEQIIFKAEYNTAVAGTKRSKSYEVSNAGVGLGDLEKNSLMISHGKGRVTFFKEESFYREQKFVKNKILDDKDSGDIAQIFPADFNNDGLTDYLVYHATRTADSEDNSGWGGTSGINTGSWGPVSMEFKLGKETQDGSIVFEPNWDYHLSSNFQIVKPHDKRESTLEFTLLFPSIPVFGDFDGNKKVDILLCGERSGIAYNTRKGFVEQAHFSCPKESVASDINLDGITDLITKDKVYLGTQDGLVLTDVVPQGIKDIQGKLKANEIKFGVFDLNLDGLPEPLKENQSIYTSDIHGNKNFQFWSVEKGLSSYERKEIYPIYPLMNKLKMQEGGEIRVTYEINASIPVVKTVVYDNLQNLPRVESLNLYKPFFDPHTNEILGFTIVRKQDHATSYFPGKINVAEYFRDNKGDDVWLRAQKHGLINREYLCELNGCDDLIKSLLNDNRIFATYLQAKEYSYDIVHPFQDGRYLIYPSRTSVMNFKSIDHENGTNSQTDIKTSETRFSNFSDWGPLSKLITEYDAIKNTSQQKQTISRYKMFDGIFRLAEEQIRGTNGGNQVTLSHVIHQHTGSLKDNSLSIKTITRTTEGTNNGSFTESRNYNSAGLLSFHVNASGAMTTYDYSGKNFTGVSERNETGLVSHKMFNDFGELIFQSTSSSEGVLSKITTQRLLNGKLIGLSTGSQELSISYSYTPAGAEQTIKVSGGASELLEIRIHDGFGKLLTAEQRQGQKVVTLKDEKIDSFGLSLVQRNKNLRHNNENYQPQDVYSVSFDSKSRKDEELNIIHDRTIVTNYQGLSLTKFEDNILLFKEKRNGLGLLETISTNTKNILINQNENDELFKLGDYKFSRDLRGNIIQVEKSGKVLFEQFISPDRVSVNESFTAYMDKLGRVEAVSVMEEASQTFNYDSYSRLDSINVLNGKVIESVVYDKDNAITNETIETQGKKIVVNNKYDGLKNLEAQNLKFDKAMIDLNYQNNLGMVRSVMPYIQNISYDRQGRPAQVAFKNLTLSIDADALGLVKGIRMGDLKEEYFHNSRLLIGHKESNIGKEKVVRSSFEYNDDKQLQENPSKVASKRDEFHNLTDSALQYADPMSGLLASIDGKAVKYKSLESILQVGDEQYLSGDLHAIDGNFIKYLRLDSKIIGAFICKEKCLFYPILTDYQNSVKAIFNEEGKVLVERNFTAWGELESVKHHDEIAVKIDKLIRYDFSGLIRPYKSDFLISKTRVYAPAYGQWHKIDPLLYEKPEVFTQGRILESDALSYAQGDPVNKVDPSGKVAVPVLLVGAGVIGAFTGAMGEMISNPNWTGQSVAETAGIGFVSGVALAAAPMLVPFSAITSFGGVLAAKFTVGAVLSGTSNAISQGTGDKEFSYLQLGVNSVIGGTASLLGGSLSGHGASAVSAAAERSIDFAVGLTWSSLDVMSSILFSQEDRFQRDVETAEPGSFIFRPTETNDNAFQYHQQMQEMREQMNYQANSNRPGQDG